jgi:hypothetical protein
VSQVYCCPKKGDDDLHHQLGTCLGVLDGTGGKLCYVLGILLGERRIDRSGATLKLAGLSTLGLAGEAAFARECRVADQLAHEVAEVRWRG